ncbi:hypothetical protein WKH56_05845 [Priestia sp. SB1]|uniref:hypothetical protein n=1 Tax=Priestia TaxID=2800373 RepID=UPI001DA879AC|nr:hypothetical protein [Priestia megaterium]
MAMDIGTEGFISASISNLKYATDKYSKLSSESKVQVKRITKELEEILEKERPKNK